LSRWGRRFGEMPRQRARARASEGPELTGEMHLMHSLIAEFAFAWSRRTRHKARAFQASSPKTFRVALAALSFCVHGAWCMHSGARGDGRLCLSRTHAWPALLPAAPFAVTLSAERADPRRHVLGIPPAAHAVSHGAGGILHHKSTTSMYRSLEAFASSAEYPQRPAKLSHTDMRGAYQLHDLFGPNPSLVHFNSNFGDRCIHDVHHR
jgi:hypothetical protein